jgi:hypothetical protein
MAVIHNLAAFHAAMAALAPIVGVAQDGTIFFDPSATPAQIAAANAAAAAYTDVPPQMMPVELALARMTDAEYQALIAFTNTHVQAHRLLTHIHQLDMSQTQAQNLVQALVTANVLTSARAAVVFAAPPVPPPPPVVVPSPPH